MGTITNIIRRKRTMNRTIRIREGIIINIKRRPRMRIILSKRIKIIRMKGISRTKVIA
jgi:hypothetical protein